MKENKAATRILSLIAFGGIITWKLFQNLSVADASAVIGIVIAAVGIFFTWRQNKNTEENQRQSRFQKEIDELKASLNKNIDDLESFVADSKKSSEKTDFHHSGQIMTLTRDLVTLQSALEFHLTVNRKQVDEVRELKQEVQELTTQIYQIKSELIAEISKLKSDFNSELAKIKADNAAIGRLGNLVLRLNKMEAKLGDI